MKTSFKQIIASALVLALGPVVASASGTPVQRPGGNFYQVVTHDEITWNAAKLAADESIYMGIAGHLATLTSPGEDAFVDQLRQDAFDNEELNQGQVWIGGSQLSGQASVGDGWFWENGEGMIPGMDSTLPHAKWADGEPNDGLTDPPNVEDNQENHLTSGRFGLGGGWNDEGTAIASIGGFIAEFNVVPQANDDLVSTDPLTESGETISIDVLANDDLMSQDIVAINVSGLTGSPPPGATATVVGTAPNFTIEYTSAPGSGGVDTFEYTITDSDGNISNTATVSIEIDGSVSNTSSGNDIVVFGGNTVPLTVTGDVAENSAQSSVKCCTVRDPRVKLKTYWNGSQKIKHKGVPFDIGKAMSSSLADSDCADLPQPDRFDLIVPRHFSVHTEVEGSLDPDDYRFGLCVVETNGIWQGPMHMDVTSEQAVGYPVDCTRNGVKNQPLTLGLTTFPEEFTAPFMRPVTVECDPRGVAKWSTWYFVPNAVHLTNKLPSKWYVVGRFVVLQLMMGFMEFQGAVESTLINDVQSQVLAARLLLVGPTTPSEAMAAMSILDDATVEVLTPGPTSSSYPGSGTFPNPKGELASHLMAVRYAVCNELAFVDMPLECKLRPDVLGLLPPLP